MYCEDKPSSRVEASMMAGRVAGGLATVWMAATCAYVIWLRPQLRRWAASRDDASRPLPGDDLIPEAPYQTTRATAIGALPEQVWPWLMQMGYRRAGWYSYDRLEAMQGIADFADGGSAWRIIPELQGLTVGDIISMDPYGGLTVEVLEPNRALVLHRKMNVRNASLVDLSQPDPGPHIDFVWAFVLESLGDGSSRLIIRSRVDYQPRAWLAAFFFLVESPVFVIERKMLLGIKERAEKGGSHSLPQTW